MQTIIFFWSHHKNCLTDIYLSIARNIYIQIILGRIPDVTAQSANEQTNTDNGTVRPTVKKIRFTLPQQCSNSLSFYQILSNNISRYQRCLWHTLNNCINPKILK